MAYYKFSETDSSIYESLKSEWSYEGSSQETLDTDIVKFEIDGSDYFMNDCPAGFTFGSLRSYYGCHPYTSWIYTSTASPNANIRHDITAKIFPRALDNDL